MLVTLLAVIAGWFRSIGFAIGVMLLAFFFQLSILGGAPWRWINIEILGGWTLLGAVALPLILGTAVSFLIGMGLRWIRERFKRPSQP